MTSEPGDDGDNAEVSATNGDDLRSAARLLAAQANRVGQASGRTTLQLILSWLSHGRLGQARWHPEVSAGLVTPWRDTPSYGRPGWRERAAYLGEEEVFAVDYIVCSRCSIGWVESPFTHDDYTRCGLATAGLAAIRADHPGFTWYTAGGHFRDSEAFWSANGRNVPGSYNHQPRCLHSPGL